MDLYIFDSYMLVVKHIQLKQHIQVYSLVASRSYSVGKHISVLHLLHDKRNSVHMDLDYINLLVYRIQCDDKQQMDRPNSLADMNSLEYDLIHRRLLVFRKYQGKDQHICY